MNSPKPPVYWTAVDIARELGRRACVVSDWWKRGYTVQPEAFTAGRRPLWSDAQAQAMIKERRAATAAYGLRRSTVTHSDDIFVAIDADCPGCGWPERRLSITAGNTQFSCSKCDYVSKERNA